MTTTNHRNSYRRALVAQLDCQNKYPRDVEAAVLMTLPLSIVSVGRLSIDVVHSELRRRRVPISCGLQDRALFGCLVAFGDHGLIFVEALDSAPERRMTVAHEAAHFLIDYIEPRIAAVNALGQGIRAVLDGRRRPSDDERVGGFLTNVPFRPHVHLMSRDQAYCSGIEELEADQLAFEMLAPSILLRDSVRDEKYARRSAASKVLIDRFGFPSGAATLYARLLFPTPDETSLRKQFSIDG